MSHHKFNYTDENIFGHAIRKIGLGHLLIKSHTELTTDEKEDLKTLEEEYARLRSVHIKGHDKKTGHSKAAKLEPIPKDMEETLGKNMWFYEPHDLHSWGPTKILDTYLTPDGRRIVKINSHEAMNSPDGHVTYLTEEKKEICAEEAPQECAEHLFRDFCVQAAIICGLKSDIIKSLKDHHDDIKHVMYEPKEYKEITVEHMSEPAKHQSQQTQAYYNHIPYNYTHAPLYAANPHNSSGLMQPIMNQLQNWVTQNAPAIIPQITDAVIKKMVR